MGRVRAGSATYAETRFGAAASYGPVTVDFSSGANSTMTVFAGYWAPNADSWLRLDTVTLVPR